MRLITTAFILLLSFQTFAGDHQEGRGEGRRGDGRRGHDSDINIFDISNSLIVTSYTLEQQKGAVQVINDAQDFILTGRMSFLLDQKIHDIQKDNEDLSLEDSLDLILALPN